MDKNTLTQHANKILNALGIKEDDCLQHWPVLNTIRTKNFYLNGVTVTVEITVFDYKEPHTCRIDIDFRLPSEGVLADTFMDHCAKIEHTPKNHHHEYCSGPMYRDFITELNAKKHTFACCPWGNHMFYVRSEGYTIDEIEDAVNNAISLTVQFTKHFTDLAIMRFWKPTDPEVIAKAKEIVSNADFEETDCDREERAHWLRDKNSFFKGWFYPFNDHGKGTFDTCYKPYYAAIGYVGTFEHAVSSILLFDENYIAKARKACRIREEKETIKY